MKSITINIEGMSCASCQNKIEKAVLATGAVECNVNLIKEQATVLADDSIDTADITAAINNIGYEASVVYEKTTSNAPTSISTNLIHSKFDLDGMTCASCETAVRKAVTKLPGVDLDSVQVQALPTYRLELTFDGSNTSNDDIVKAVAGAGYGASLLQSTSLDVQLGTDTSSPPKVIFLKTDASLQKAKIHLDNRAGIVQEVTILDEEGLLTVLYDDSVLGLRTLVEELEEKFGTPVDALFDRKSSDDNLEEKNRRKAIAWRNQFFIAAVFAVPVFVLSMLKYSPSIGPVLESYMFSTMSYLDFWTWLGATPVQFYSGRHFYKDSWYSLKSCTFGMSVLIALGSSVAYFYSAFAAVYNAVVVPDTIFDQEFDTSSLLITLVLLGKWIESYAKSRTTSAISSLSKLVPEEATLQGGRKVPLKLLMKGDVIIIKPGESVPADAIVVEGRSNVDESMITGENMPVLKTVDDEIIGGTINTDGHLVAKITRIGQDTTLASIVRMVENAQASKIPIQAFADKISSIFVPMVVIIALITFIVWAAVLSTGSYYTQGFGAIPYSILFAVSVLVISCPCALGLGAPTAILVGNGVAAKHGILLKPASVENSRNINVVVFDKTGTLTMGKPSVSDILLLSDNLGTDDKSNRKAVLALAATAEQNSEHPIAKGIIESALEEGVQLLPFSDFTNEPGLGIKCVINDKNINIGNRRSLKQNHITTRPGTFQAMEYLEKRGQTAVVLSVNGHTEAVIGLRDQPKKDAKLAIETLHKQGIKVYMLTGDNKRTAMVIGKELGLNSEDIIADVLPSEKADAIERLQQGGGNKVCMVGDGINDAGALSTANVGIALGAGTDIAIESAGVVLINSNIFDVVIALDICRTIYRRIIINLVFSLFYNTVSIPIAAGVLYPVILYQIPPYVATLAMVLSSVSVILSSLHLNIYTAPKTTLKKPHDSKTTLPTEEYTSRRQQRVHPGCAMAWGMDCTCGDDTSSKPCACKH